MVREDHIRRDNILQGYLKLSDGVPRSEYEVWTGATSGSGFLHLDHLDDLDRIGKPTDEYLGYMGNNRYLLENLDKTMKMLSMCTFDKEKYRESSTAGRNMNIYMHFNNDVMEKIIGQVKMIMPRLVTQIGLNYEGLVDASREVKKNEEKITKLEIELEMVTKEKTSLARHLSYLNEKMKKEQTAKMNALLGVDDVGNIDFGDLGENPDELRYSERDFFLKKKEWDATRERMLLEQREQIQDELIKTITDLRVSAKKNLENATSEHEKLEERAIVAESELQKLRLFIQSKGFSEGEMYANNQISPIPQDMMNQEDVPAHLKERDDKGETPRFEFSASDKRRSLTQYTPSPVKDASTNDVHKSPVTQKRDLAPARGTQDTHLNSSASMPSPSSVSNVPGSSPIQTSKTQGTLPSSSPKPSSLGDTTNHVKDVPQGTLLSSLSKSPTHDESKGFVKDTVSTVPKVLPPVSSPSSASVSKSPNHNESMLPVKDTLPTPSFTSKKEKSVKEKKEKKNKKKSLDVPETMSRSNIEDDGMELASMPSIHVPTVYVKVASKQQQEQVNIINMGDHMSERQSSKSSESTNRSNERSQEKGDDRPKERKSRNKAPKQKKTIDDGGVHGEPSIESQVTYDDPLIGKESLKGSRASKSVSGSSRGRQTNESLKSGRTAVDSAHGFINVDRETSEDSSRQEYVPRNVETKQTSIPRPSTAISRPSTAKEVNEIFGNSSAHDNPSGSSHGTADDFAASIFSMRLASTERLLNTFLRREPPEMVENLLAQAQADVDDRLHHRNRASFTLLQRAQNASECIAQKGVINQEELHDLRQILSMPSLGTDEKPIDGRTYREIKDRLEARTSAVLSANERWCNRVVDQVDEPDEVFDELLEDEILEYPATTRRPLSSGRASRSSRRPGCSPRDIRRDEAILEKRCEEEDVPNPINIIREIEDLRLRRQIMHIFKTFHKRAPTTTDVICKYCRRKTKTKDIFERCATRKVDVYLDEDALKHNASELFAHVGGIEHGSNQTSMRGSLSPQRSLSSSRPYSGTPGAYNRNGSLGRGTSPINTRGSSPIINRSPRQDIRYQSSFIINNNNNNTRGLSPNRSPRYDGLSSRYQSSCVMSNQSPLVVGLSSASSISSRPNTAEYSNKSSQRKISFTQGNKVHPNLLLLNKGAEVNQAQSQPTLPTMIDRSRPITAENRGRATIMPHNRPQTADDFKKGKVSHVAQTLKKGIRKTISEIHKDIDLEAMGWARR